MTGLMGQIPANVGDLILLGDNEVGTHFAVPIGAMAAFWVGRRLLGLARGFFGG